MNPHPIYLVAGASGTGKTTWIYQHLTARSQPSAYLCLGAGETHIDATYIAATCADLVQIPTETSWAELDRTLPLYIEIASQIDLSTLKLPIDPDLCQKIAIVPKGMETSAWHDWATAVFIGEAAALTVPLTASPRWVLTGEVLDPASLNVFWDELIHGAYGTVARAKGIFEIVDGRSIYFSFGLGYPNCAYIDLPLPPTTNGRPTRFSGLEIVGDDLQPSIITDTLQECSLDDRALAYYQQQLRSQLSTESPVEVQI